MRITSKGQITIPAEIRERAGLHPGTDVEFVVEGDSVRLVKAKGGKPESRGERIVRHLRGKGRFPMGTDELMKLFRED
jgi:AbrB family looped-hinge helix DNA binding protein